MLLLQNNFYGTQPPCSKKKKKKKKKGKKKSVERAARESTDSFLWTPGTKRMIAPRERNRSLRYYFRQLSN